MKFGILRFSMMALASMAGSSPAFASGSGGTQLIDAVESSGGVLYLHYSAGYPNPDACANNTRAVVTSTNTQQDQQLALATTSIAGGKTLTLWFSGCQNTAWGSTSPVISSMRMNK